MNENKLKYPVMYTNIIAVTYKNIQNKHARPHESNQHKMRTNALYCLFQKLNYTYM